MAHQKDSHNPSFFSHSPEGTKKERLHHGRLSTLVEQLHSGDALYLISGICQSLLGVGVLAAAVLGLIRPLWLSLLLTATASMATTVGIYTCYSGLSKINSNTLLRDAMRRIVEDQN